MDLHGLNLGFGICGSFCTIKKSIEQMKILTAIGVNIFPVMSFNTQNIDTRFGTAESIKNKIKDIAGKEIITSIKDAEPVGPKKMFDVFLISPCTGNTLAKLNHGLVDSPVLMAAKSHLRNNKPVVLSIATNDAIGANFENIGRLINTKNIYFVPFGQDDYINKPKSMVAKFEKIPDTIAEAINGNQIQPVII